MVDAQQEQKELEEALAACEERLETPVVPGEAVDWINSLKSALDELLLRFTEHSQATHRKQLDEIGAEDSGLLSRVEKMRQEDRAIADELREWQTRIRHVSDGIEQIEPDEAKAEPALERIVQHGLDLVIRIRKQERAIATWLVEALQRDRGVAD